jgi:hypothetical protein
MMLFFLRKLALCCYRSRKWRLLWNQYITKARPAHTTSSWQHTTKLHNRLQCPNIESVSNNVITSDALSLFQLVSSPHSATQSCPSSMVFQGICKHGCNPVKQLTSSDHSISWLINTYYNQYRAPSEFRTADAEPIALERQTNGSLPEPEHETLKAGLLQVGLQRLELGLAQPRKQLQRRPWFGIIAVEA